ncbi:DUF4291 domain-containing protein, partial [bacterium]
MQPLNEIRATYDASSIVVYQAYSDSIARAALSAGKFVPPFSMGRMTWIKPSYLWLMERSNWGRKSGQENILAVRISRQGFDEALSLGVLTGYEAGIHSDRRSWQQTFDGALVHVQWDPERSIRGADLGINSIQVGLSRGVIERFVEEWIIEITDLTPLTRKIHTLLTQGQAEKARRFLPKERVYPVEKAVAEKPAASAKRSSAPSKRKAESDEVYRASDAAAKNAE